MREKWSKDSVILEMQRAFLEGFRNGGSCRVSLYNRIRESGVMDSIDVLFADAFSAAAIMVVR